jgi:hypothetical protein
MALDKLTQIAQQTERKASQSIRVLEADGERDPLAAIANSVLGLDSLKQPKAMTSDELKTFLALTGVTLSVDAGMRTFADAGERALMVPQFTGQLGTQRDTNLVYISTGTSAGDWGLLTASLAMILAGTFTADATGRGKFANEFVNTALLASDAVTTAKILDLNVTAGKLAAALDLSGKTLTMPANHWLTLAPNGAPVRVAMYPTPTWTALSTQFVLGVAVPTTSQGTEVVSGAINLSSATSHVLVQFNFFASTAGATSVVAAVFRGDGTDAIYATANAHASTTPEIHSGAYFDSPGVSGLLTYRLRVGPTSATSVYLNGSSSTNFFGGKAVGLLTMTEIKA